MGKRRLLNCYSPARCECVKHLQEQYSLGEKNLRMQKAMLHARISGASQAHARKAC